jgi:3-isopropylmalate dehydrogenase
MKHIVVIPGDGIGTEVTDSAVEVLKKIDEIYKIGLTYEWKDAGGASYDQYGVPLTEDTIEACRKADAILFGAVGGDQWDHLEPSLRPEKAILGLRKSLGLYVNLRPVRIQDSMIEYSPLKPEIAKGTDILIVRELVGGIYFGKRCESEIVNGAEQAWDVEKYSVPEVERITRFAMEAARKRKGHVTSVDKSNVLASSRLWRRTVIKLHDEEYKDVRLDHMYVDNCAQQFAIHPSSFDVVVTSNMFGDILSDEAAVLSGSIGMLPSASIGEETSLYEPIHGSAPDIAGKGIANPIATILSAAMLLRYSLNEDKAADAIEKAVNDTLEEGYRTGDIYREGMKRVDGKGMKEAILAHLG